MRYRFSTSPTPAWQSAATALADLAARADQDGHGFASDQFEGDDCDDTDGGVSPARYDGIDADCSGGSDNDYRSTFMNTPVR